MFIRHGIFVLFLVLGLAQSSDGCSICDPNFQQKPTLRQSARMCKFVVLGTLSNPRLEGDKGLTDLNLEKIILDDRTLGTRKTLTVPGYIPVNAKTQDHYLVFGDITNGKLDILSSQRVQGMGIVTYLLESLKIDDRERTKVLQFCFEHLDSADPDVALDAFHELAKANDREIAEVARLLSPDKFRKLIKDPKTPPERLGIFAYLLGACGTKEDAVLLTSIIKKNDERTSSALSGLLGGLIELRPSDGWATVIQILEDPKRRFSDKLAVLGTLRFNHACKPIENHKQIVQAMAAIVSQGDMADMAIEDLRRWQWWDLTKQILAQYAKPSHAAPLVKRSIIRYALCCTDADALRFVQSRKQAEPAVVKQVEDSLEFEKPLLSSPKNKK